MFWLGFAIGMTLGALVAFTTLAAAHVGAGQD